MEVLRTRTLKLFTICSSGKKRNFEFFDSEPCLTI